MTYFDRDYGYTQWNDKAGNFQGHMLFLYRNDHLETKNVADAPENQEIVAHLRKEILARRGKDFMKQVPEGDKLGRKGVQANKRKK